MKSLLEKIIEKAEYIAIKCYTAPGNSDHEPYKINLFYYGGGSPEEWLKWKNRVLKTIDGQSISTEPQRYTFTERLTRE